MAVLGVAAGAAIASGSRAPPGSLAGDRWPAPGWRPCCWLGRRGGVCAGAPCHRLQPDRVAPGMLEGL